MVSSTLLLGIRNLSMERIEHETVKPERRERHLVIFHAALLQMTKNQIACKIILCTEGRRSTRVLSSNFGFQTIR